MFLPLVVHERQFCFLTTLAFSGLQDLVPKEGYFTRGHALLNLAFETDADHSELLLVEKAVAVVTETVTLPEDTKLLQYIGDKEEFIWNL